MADFRECEVCLEYSLEGLRLSVAGRVARFAPVVC